MGSINGVREIVTTVAFSPDGGLVAAGDVNHTPATRSRGDTARLPSGTPSSGKLLWLLRKKTGWVNSVAFSPDGKTVAAAYETGPVVLYDARTGEPSGSLRPEGAGGLHATRPSRTRPTGSLVTGSWAGIVQRWNPADGAELGRPTLVATAPVVRISFSPDGSIFATAGGSDNLAKLWTTSTLAAVRRELPRHVARNRLGQRRLHTGRKAPGRRLGRRLRADLADVRRRVGSSTPAPSRVAASPARSGRASSADGPTRPRAPVRCLSATRKPAVSGIPEPSCNGRIPRPGKEQGHVRKAHHDGTRQSSFSPPRSSRRPPVPSRRTSGRSPARSTTASSRRRSTPAHRCRCRSGEPKNEAPFTTRCLGRPGDGRSASHDLELLRRRGELAARRPRAQELGCSRNGRGARARPRGSRAGRGGASRAARRIHEGFVRRLSESADAASGTLGSLMGG